MSGFLLRGCALPCAIALFVACGQAKPGEPAQTAHNELHAPRSAPVAQPYADEGDANPPVRPAGLPAAEACERGQLASPLVAAAFAGEVETARMLIVGEELDAGARPACGASALMMALTPYTDEPGTTTQERRRRRLDKLDAAGLFLTRCFEVGRADEHGMTALHVAATAPDPERIITRLITRMLECGVTPDPKSADGITPLMMAVQAKRKAIAKFLVEAGADLNARSNAGETPLALAESSKDRELVKTLRKAVPADAGL